MSTALRNKVILFFIVGSQANTVEQDLITRLEEDAASVRIRSLLQDTTYGGRAEQCDGIAIADNANIPAAYSDAGDFPILTPAAQGTVVSVAHGAVVSVLTAAGTKQVETATAAGTVTVAGNAAVVITSAILAGSPLTYAVPVLVGDTAALWAAKVRAYLAQVAVIIAKYTVGGSTTAIILTAKTPAANDGTLNIALATGTATGITTAASSANTTGGVAPTVEDTGTAVVAAGAVGGVLRDNP